MKSLTDYANIVNAYLESIIPTGNADLDIDAIPALQAKSMRYSLLSGGKRLRASLFLAAIDMLESDSREYLDYAAAIEMIHAYSLIHDDLPCMDDDELRRGKPTNHIVFGEAQAMLAGDGLLNLAYETMLNRAARGDNLATHIRAMAEIARGAGSAGMVGGQAMDLFYEQSDGADAAALNYIHINKTARMFMHPLRAAAILAGAAGQEIDALGEYGKAIGLLFQATDDILDVTSDAATLGKSIGKDARDGKLTYISLYDMEGATMRAAGLRDTALISLEIFGERAELFIKFANDVIGRKN
jgi:geranylgeranyl diphosphate synthase type II